MSSKEPNAVTDLVRIEELAASLGWNKSECSCLAFLDKLAGGEEDTSAASELELEEIKETAKEHGWDWDKTKMSVSGFIDTLAGDSELLKKVMEALQAAGQDPEAGLVAGIERLVAHRELAERELVHSKQLHTGGSVSLEELKRYATDLGWDMTKGSILAYIEAAGIDSDPMHVLRNQLNRVVRPRVPYGYVVSKSRECDSAWELTRHQDTDPSGRVVLTALPECINVFRTEYLHPDAAVALIFAATTGLEPVHYFDSVPVGSHVSAFDAMVKRASDAQAEVSDTAFVAHAEGMGAAYSKTKATDR